MLDFYLIADQKAKPDYPEQVGLQFAGSLDEKTFSNLKAKKLIGDQFDYYSDFRWGTTMIEQMYQQVLYRRIHEDSDVKKILTLFDIAKKNEAGLIAYAD